MHRSLDVGERLSSGEGWCGELDAGGDGDDLGAIGELGGVLAERRELGHDRLELGDHRVVVDCQFASAIHVNLASVGCEGAAAYG